MPVGPSRYDRLDAAQVEATLARLHRRVVTTMPGRHLADVVDQVRQVVVGIEGDARAAQRRAAVRIGSWVAVAGLAALIVAALVSAVRTGLRADQDVHGFEWLGVVESGVNDVVFAAVAIWFLRSLPERVERRRLLRVLYRLRSLAHVTDMHQMTKDEHVAETADTPQRVLGQASLVRYLELCSDLLSLTAKAAALCGEDTTDAVVLDTVSEIETLTANMSRKIWQKISLVRLAPGRAEPGT